MSSRVLVFYGSYRSDRQGIRLASWLIRSFVSAGHEAELIDAKTIGLPMLDRMFKEYPSGSAPEALATLAAKIRDADAFVFVTGEYNWSVQPGLKNLTDISLRNGIGGRLRSRATRRAASLEHDPGSRGTAFYPRWA